MSQRFIMPISFWVNGNGGIGAGYKLNFYESSTTTRQNTYSSPTLTVPNLNTNPVVADADGEFGNIFLLNEAYKVILTDEDGVTIWTADPVSPAADGSLIYTDNGEFVNSALAVGDGLRNLTHTTGLTGYYNHTFGLRCGTNITTGSYNTLVGFECGEDLTTGDFNTAIGEAAMIYNVSGDANTCVGWKAGLSKDGVGLADYNTFVGYSAGIESSAGSNNVGVGAFVMANSGFVGGENVAVGRQAGFGLTTGDSNTLVGYFSGYQISTGINNTVVGGALAGSGITTGSNNTIVGNKTGLSTSLAQTVILADGAGNSRVQADLTALTLFASNGTTSFVTYTEATMASANAGPVGLKSYAKASLPSAATTAQLIYVSDDTGGAVPAFSDGVNWRRVTDRNVIS